MPALIGISFCLQTKAVFQKTQTDMNSLLAKCLLMYVQVSVSLWSLLFDGGFWLHSLCPMDVIVHLGQK